MSNFITIIIFIMSVTVFASDEMKAVKGQRVQPLAPPHAQENFLDAGDEEHQAYEQNSNCQISIHTTRFSGLQDKQIFYTQAKDKSDCAQRAQPHKYNLYPTQIKSIVVDYEFIKRRNQK